MTASTTRTETTTLGTVTITVQTDLRHVERTPTTLEITYRVDTSGADVYEINTEATLSYTRCYVRNEFSSDCAHFNEWDTPGLSISGIDQFKGCVPYEVYGQVMLALMRLHAKVEKELDFS